MTLSTFKTSIISAAALTAAALAPAAGAISTAGYSADTKLRVDHSAVNMVSQSWLDAADAYAKLSAGNTAEARRELSEALAKLRQASSKDSSLGVSFNGQTKPVNALHDELAGLSPRLNTPEAKQQLQRMLQTAGVI